MLNRRKTNIIVSSFYIFLYEAQIKIFLFWKEIVSLILISFMYSAITLLRLSFITLLKLLMIARLLSDSTLVSSSILRMLCCEEDRSICLCSSCNNGKLSLMY